MAMRSRTTFAKRQKELARQEKQRAKAQRRLERKLNHQDQADPASGELESSPASGSGMAELSAGEAGTAQIDEHAQEGTS